ncbi:RagB/SusD family nutrient uptake outer membrane protein [Flammeovirga aprica]|uniref:RagB/SusD family nutrient uptake outer membrane protein n=1 Tax=Flammeovirga aprica JL-4 TaxID=694437 RepID=A0A7X9NZX6_9BACT|nr:RagB/SusD family nutrient uptake outer membrane protein [Flammeovirga aprica]NME66770.1 RagB/SusD family nutrient uptake outer membrane protein [Flammeovirga aprica JL-4]
MKSIIYKILFGVLVITGTVSCDNFLEVEVKDRFIAEEFYNSSQQMEMGVNGIYNALAGGSNGNMYGGQMAYVFGEADTDLAQERATGLNNDRRRIAHYGVTPFNRSVQETWKEHYQGITRANWVIQSGRELLAKNQVDDAGNYVNSINERLTVTDSLSIARSLGEGLFLRGFMYFNLVRMWGDIPLITEPTTTYEGWTGTTRTPSQLVYKQIEKDMKEAEAYIPYYSEINHDGRIGKTTVQGMLAKIYAFWAGYPVRNNEKWKEASTYALKVKNSAEHFLLDDFIEIFNDLHLGEFNPSETMFNIQFNFALNRPSGVGATYGIFIDAANTEVGRGLASIVLMKPFVDTYYEEDVRLTEGIAKYRVGKDGTEEARTDNNNHHWTTAKFDRRKVKEGLISRNQTSIDWCILRYSDVLLLLAEAENEINGGPTALAYESINLVRERARPATDKTGLIVLPDLEGLSYGEFKESLQQERAWELVGEGERKFDLIRWNILAKKIRETSQKAKLENGIDSRTKEYPYVAADYFIEGQHELLPIPQKEIDVNPKIRQNPGY